MASKQPNLAGVNVLLGVSGGIAAYKAAGLASSLTGAGAVVNVVMTDSACELVTPRTFEAVTGRPVHTSLWAATQEFRIGHISLADQADIVVVAPATANIIAKMAMAIADDLLSTALCTAWSKPTIVAPAMNANMWTNPAVATNIEKLKQRGATVVGPERGRLACGAEGIGRMAEPEMILEAVMEAASKLKRPK
ncbi:MAG TPA: flavoprotein [Sedimentisphaerales bacterium]|nr:flavoprotein [Sedimentisphaerales bacterium]